MRVLEAESEEAHAESGELHAHVAALQAQLKSDAAQPAVAKLQVRPLQDAACVWYRGSASAALYPAPHIERAMCYKYSLYSLASIRSPSCLSGGARLQLGVSRRGRLSSCQSADVSTLLRAGAGEQPAGGEGGHAGHGAGAHQRAGGGQPAAPAGGAGGLRRRCAARRAGGDDGARPSLPPRRMSDFAATI
jgi:hypothetical protein